jgi:hypothetical protein
MLAAVGSKTDLLAINSVHGAVVTSLVQQKIVQDNVNSVHGSQTTELENSLEHGDWRVFLVSYQKDPSQTRDKKIQQMVAGLRRHIQSCRDCPYKFILCTIFAEREVMQSSQWKIFLKVLSQHVAGGLKILCPIRRFKYCPKQNLADILFKISP